MMDAAKQIPALPPQNQRSCDTAVPVDLRRRSKLTRLVSGSSVTALPGFSKEEAPVCV